MTGVEGEERGEGNQRVLGKERGVGREEREREKWVWRRPEWQIGSTDLGKRRMKEKETEITVAGRKEEREAE